MGVPVTVTIDSDLLEQVNEFNLDVARMLEHEVHLRRAAQREAQEFYEENRESIDSYNAYVEKHGTVGSRHGLRRG